MGVVYEAYQLGMDRLVAVKLLTYAPSSEPEDLKRFEQEAKVLNALSHKHIVKFYTYGYWDGSPYITMERLIGKSLSEVIAERPDGIGRELALKICIQICDALAHAHSEGVFHRDIKPTNVILTGAAPDRDPEIKLIDFGLAKLTGLDGHQKLTRTGMALGSVMYMSPEQCAGHPVDARSDVYAVGCLLYECLTGEQLFGRADEAIAVMFKHLNQPPAKAGDRWNSLPPDVKPVIAKCLAKKPKQRYASAADLETDLQHLLDSEAPVGADMPAGTEDDSYHGFEHSNKGLDGFRRFLTEGSGGGAAVQQRSAAKRAGMLVLVAVALGLAVIAALHMHQHAQEQDGTAGGAKDSAHEQLPTIMTSENLRFVYEHARDALVADQKSEEGLRAITRANELANKQKSTDLGTVFRIKTDYAKALNAWDLFDQAYPINLEVVAISQKLPAVLQVGALCDLSKTCRRRGRVKEALSYATRAKDLAEKNLQGVERPPQIATNGCVESWDEIAECYEAEHNLKAAESAMRQSMTYLRQYDNPMAHMKRWMKLSRMCKDQRKLKEALEAMEEWEAIELETPPSAESSGDLSMQCVFFGDLLADANRRQEAEKYFARAVEEGRRTREIWQDDHLGFIYTRQALNFSALNKVSEAHAAGINARRYRLAPEMVRDLESIAK